ncbi:MAG: class I SAM-dependent methyltransferase [Longimicrobiales bacterium]|nr:class I SAM-dependent methyltransferase [Longimicrobiales bacterium]
MSWLEHFAASSSESARESPASAPEERAAPGLASLFAALSPDGRHSVLDLGSAEGRRLRLLGRFARSVRFAELVPFPPQGADLDAALRRLGDRPGDGYDVVLAWNVFDRLQEAERERLLERLVEVTSPGARLHAMTDASGSAAIQPVRITVLELDRLATEPAGPSEPARPPLLPRQVERLLRPFDVVRGFSLKGGWREYVAQRGEPPS